MSVFTVMMQYLIKAMILFADEFLDRRCQSLPALLSDVSHLSVVLGSSILA